MIQTLSAKKFKLFDSFSADDFKKINLIVGKNNCGKTTLLEALFLIIGASNALLPVRLNAFRNLSSSRDEYWGPFFHNFQVDSPFEIDATVEVDNQREKRVLRASPNRSGRLITEANNGSVNVEKGYSETKQAIQGLDYHVAIERENGEPVLFDITVMEESGQGYKSNLPPNYEEKLIGTFLGPSTKFTDLHERLTKLSIDKKIDKLVNSLGELEPRLRDIRLGEGQTVYCDIGLDKLMPLNMMGAGFISALAAVVATLHAEENILLVDEIDSGLHYSALEILWRAVIKASQKNNAQIFATTHSYECVQAFYRATQGKLSFDEDAFRLFRMEHVKGGSRMIAFTPEDFATAIDSNWEVR